MTLVLSVYSHVIWLLSFLYLLTWLHDQYIYHINCMSSFSFWNAPNLYTVMLGILRMDLISFTSNSSFIDILIYFTVVTISKNSWLFYLYYKTNIIYIVHLSPLHISKQILEINKINTSERYSRALISNPSKYGEWEWVGRK